MPSIFGPSSDPTDSRAAPHPAAQRPDLQRHAPPSPPRAPTKTRAAIRAPAPAVQAPVAVRPSIDVLQLPAVTGEIETRAPGVYFGLSAAAYHADPSLGSTDIKRLVRSAADYWWASKLNPNRDDDTDSAAKAWGRAFHTLVLEGPAAFAQSYAIEPDKAAYPALLASVDDLKAYCKELAEPVSGTKAELTQRIRKHDAKRPIWDEILEAFKAEVSRRGLEVLKPAVRDAVVEAAGMVSANPHLANAFTGGVAEVSVFWRENGIPLKARFDYLKPAVFLDLKKLGNPMELPFDHAALKAIGNYRYDIQVRHYLDGYRALLDLARKDLVFGDCPLPEGWPALMADPDEARCVLVFHQTSGAPIAKGFEFAAGSSALTRAAREIDAAKQAWQAAVERFGTSGPWLAEDPIRSLEDEDFPRWMRDPAAPVSANTEETAS